MESKKYEQTFSEYPGNPAKATLYGWVSKDEVLRQKKKRIHMCRTTEGNDQEFKNEKKKTNWK